MDIRPLDREGVEATAEVLASAFDVDAAYRYLFPGDARHEGLREFFRGNLSLHLDHGCTWIGARDGRVLGTLTVRPPGGVPIGLLPMVRHGLGPFLLHHGVGAVRRLFWLRDTYAALEEELAGAAPRWLLHMMAVDPATQGQGVGSQLVDRVLAQTVGATRHSLAVLTTHLERNLVFYQRVGFEVVLDRMLVPPKAEPYRVWGMVKRPVR